MNKQAEIFAPGEFLQDELEARNWSQVELAEIMGRPARLINEIIAGKRAITPETAVHLGDALGTGPELWMNLEGQYQLSKVQTSDDAIARRGRLYSLFPVREMIKRQWIVASPNIAVLEQHFLNFFQLAQLDDRPRLGHAAKKAQAAVEPSIEQLAWLFRARQLASAMVLPAYRPALLQQALPRLSALRSAPEEARHVARVLSECGVRFVVVEPIPGTKIDGACFWLTETQPVIALSLRLDRIDNFWFVLRHEIEHVLHGHGRDREFILDQDMETAGPTSLLEEEIMANKAAAAFCVDESELTHFLDRVGWPIAEQRVVLFAQRLQVHPGLVVGQMNRKLNRYDLFRRHLVKIRSFVADSAIADGWNRVHHREVTTP